MKKNINFSIKQVFFSIAFVLLISNIRVSLLAGTGFTACDEVLGFPQIEWSEEFEGNVSPSYDDCPCNCQIKFYYKYRIIQPPIGNKFHDIFITKIKMSPCCSDCDFNYYRLILWAIWSTYKDAWELDPGTARFNNRFSAASCWKKEYSIHEVDFLPCSSTCCRQMYSVARDPVVGVVYFWTAEPFDMTNNCTQAPCTVFDCSKIYDIDMTVEESLNYHTHNPTFPLIKQQTDIDFKNINIYPNPAENILYVDLIGDNNIIVLIEIHNQINFSMFKQEFLINSINTTKLIDISGFPQGLYYLKLSYPNEKVFNKKFIIIR